MNSTVAFCNGTAENAKKYIYIYIYIVFYSQFVVDVVDGDDMEEIIYYFNVQ